MKPFPCTHEAKVRMSQPMADELEFIAKNAGKSVAFVTRVLLGRAMTCGLHQSITDKDVHLPTLVESNNYKNWFLAKEERE